MTGSMRRACALGALGAWVLSRGPIVPASDTCDRDNGGITLPQGFCAVIFADEVGIARHLAVASNGDVYVNLESGQRTSAGTSRLRGDKTAGGILVLRDTNGDFRADVELRIPTAGGTGITMNERYLYVSTENTIVRYTLGRGRLGPLGTPDTIVDGIPGDGHRSRSLALDDSGRLFVNVGSNSNACRGSRSEPRGQDPCAELRERSGIWRYDAGRMHQRHPTEGVRWGTGIRNAVGLAWNSALRGLYATSHGRDRLHELWPQYFTVQQNAEKPSEEFMRVERGHDYGWPYCYHDPELNKKVLAPEYGGDGKEVGRCADKAMPLIGFPAHWGPNGLLFYTGTMFPERYRGGAFIAFHGSWNRMPLPEEGYKVVFAPLRGGRPTGTYETFADGFAAGFLEPVQARHRPMGLAQGPDGALFISDDQAGRIWWVTYTGR